MRTYDLDVATEREQDQILNELREALAQEGLGLCYQPVVRSGDGEILAFEALLRWRSPTRGQVSPGVFVPVAERNGLMPMIGRWVIRTGARQLAEWQRLGLVRDISLHVNLSLSELLDPDLPADAEAELQEAGLRPDQFCFEVTERDLDTGGEAADRGVERLVRRGFRPVLDDFGIDSSVEILTRHPFQFAKIDRRLLNGTDAPRHWSRLLRGIGGLARTLGITLVAENVEGQSEMAKIAALGFAHAQGYAFGRPETAGQVQNELSSNGHWQETRD